MLLVPGPVLPPYPSDPRIPPNIRSVGRRKFPMKSDRSALDTPNERYTLRLCGPVLEGIGGWTEFVIFRSPDQLWGFEDGVRAGCV